jgi:uncharacterized protein (DUF1697 family)
MARYAAFLRGVSPMNAKMPELKRAFEAAGFTDVATVISSGNVVFTAREAAVGALESKSERAMQEVLGRTFLTIIRPVDALERLLGTEPFRGFGLPDGVKRLVTFLRKPPSGKVALPVTLENAWIVSLKGSEAYSAYVPGGSDSPVFMTLIEKTLGKDVTTRTWETVGRVVKAARAAPKAAKAPRTPAKARTARRGR